MILDLKYLYIRSLVRKKTFTSPLPPQNTFENPNNIYIDFCTYKHRNFVHGWRWEFGALKFVRTTSPVRLRRERNIPPRVYVCRTKTQKRIPLSKRIGGGCHGPAASPSMTPPFRSSRSPGTCTPIYAYFRLFTAIYGGYRYLRQFTPNINLLLSFFAVPHH